MECKSCCPRSLVHQPCACCWHIYWDTDLLTDHVWKFFLDHTFLDSVHRFKVHFFSKVTRFQIIPLIQQLRPHHFLSGHVAHFNKIGIACCVSFPWLDYPKPYINQSSKFAVSGNIIQFVLVYRAFDAGTCTVRESVVHIFLGCREESASYALNGIGILTLLRSLESISFSI